MSKEELEAAFLADLQALLDKYGAEIEAKDHYQGYPECGEDVRMTAWLGEECVSIDLGRYLFPTKKKEDNHVWVTALSVLRKPGDRSGRGATELCRRLRSLQALRCAWAARPLRQRRRYVERLLAVC